MHAEPLIRRVINLNLRDESSRQLWLNIHNGFNTDFVCMPNLWSKLIAFFAVHMYVRTPISLGSHIPNPIHPQIYKGWRKKSH